MSKQPTPTDPNRVYLRMVANGLAGIPAGPWSIEQMLRPTGSARIHGGGANRDIDMPICYSSAGMAVWSWIAGARDEIPEMATALTNVLDIADEYAASNDTIKLAVAARLRDAITLGLIPLKDAR